MHEIDRREIREVICAVCDERQPVGSDCRLCGVSFGAYSCMECNFFDDDNSKQQYHCEHCGICRVGGRENFFHCHTCGSCYSLALRVRAFVSVATQTNLRLLGSCRSAALATRYWCIPLPFGRIELFFSWLCAGEPRLHKKQYDAKLPGLPRVPVRQRQAHFGPQVRPYNSRGLSPATAATIGAWASKQLYLSHVLQIYI